MTISDEGLFEVIGIALRTLKTRYTSTAIPNITFLKDLQSNKSIFKPSLIDNSSFVYDTKTKFNTSLYGLKFNFSQNSNKKNLDINIDEVYIIPLIITAAILLYLFFVIFSKYFIKKKKNENNMLL